jgi:hypothetical protein
VMFADGDVMIIRMSALPNDSPRVMNE